MKYTEALKQILFNPHRVFRDPPNWGYVKHNFVNGIAWVWRAMANILQYPLWIAVRILFYVTAPLSAFLLVGAIERDTKRRERQEKEMLDSYLKNTKRKERVKE